MKLYLGNLPFSASDEDIREAFSAYGTIEDLFIPLDRETNRPRGFAFITIADDDLAMIAVEAVVDVVTMIVVAVVVVIVVEAVVITKVVGKLQNSQNNLKGPLRKVGLFYVDGTALKMRNSKNNDQMIKHSFLILILFTIVFKPLRAENYLHLSGAGTDLRADQLMG